MTNQIPVSSGSAKLDLFPVPPETRALNGDRIDTSGTRWVLERGRRNRIIDFDLLNGVCTPEHINGCMWTWHSRLKQMNRKGYSSSYKTLAMQYIAAYRNLIKWLHRRNGGQLIDTISAADVASYKVNVDHAAFGKITTTLRVWIEGGFYGVAPDVIQVLEVRRSHVKGALLPVRTLDPMKGPLLEAEEQAYLSALIDSYREGKIPLEDYCLARLTLAFGQRPISSSSLRLKHFEVQINEHGKKVFFIHIPWAKQHDKKPARRFPLSGDIGRAMLSLVESIRLRFPKDSLPTGMDWEALPLFPDAYATSPEPQIADTLALRIQSVSKAINFISPRVGASDEVKVVGARMMRYTVGTRLAFKERATKEEIAHVLLHTNPDSCEAYIGVATDLLGAGFNQLYGEEFRRLANRCLNIVDDSDDDPTARGAVIRYSENGKYRPGIGRCGDKSCYHEGPIECYTCEQFRPWLRAPHQLVLNHLNQKRELMAKIDPTRTGDFDAVIIRVMLVIDACDRILAERSS